MPTPTTPPPTATPPPTTPERVRLTALVRGRVQGVGFRWSTARAAEGLGLVGWARNLADGGVEVVAEGGRAECEELLGWLRGGRTPGRVTAVGDLWGPSQGIARAAGFTTH